MNGPHDPKEGGAEPPTGGEPSRARFLGVALMAFAVLTWVAAPAALLVPLSGAQKLWTASALLVAGEVAFWASAVLLGREVFRRYRGRLYPRRLFGGRG
jgi:hypothetical protein